MIRPFFSFYGSKWRDAPRHYPAYSSIIEPFAGSAGYALRYADLQVTLCDADPVIVGVWSYLINSGASWLPFKRLRDVKTTRSNRSVEAVWINNI